MSLYDLNLGNRVVSGSRQFKVIRLKKKTARLLIWVAVCSFVLFALIADGVISFSYRLTFLFFSLGVLLLSLIGIALLYRGLLDLFILKMSKKVNPPKKKN